VVFVCVFISQKKIKQKAAQQGDKRDKNGKTKYEQHMSLLN